MATSVIYYWADNEQGYIWEEVENDDIPYFLARGWSRGWANLAKPDPTINEEAIPKKRGRPRKE